MSRKPRFNLPGIPQHVVQRGNNRKPCFFADADYRRYLDDLTAAASKYQCQIHAYVLMTNHVHLLVTPLVECGISKLMQALGPRYVRYVNKRYKRSGTLWEGRYKSSLIDSDRYLLICMRYIEMNPVRARMVEHPGDYRWSSYRANAIDESAELIDEHPVFSAMASKRSHRRHAYRELFRQDLDEEAIRQVRENLNRELVLGRAEFKDKIERMTHRQTRPGSPGRPGIRDNQTEAI
jgi:putative transposase